MSRLFQKCQQYKKPLDLVSIAFEIKEQKPHKSKKGVFLYKFK
jgi:hypothetical protein